MNVKEIIQKNRERNGANIDWRSLAETIAKEVIDAKFAATKKEIETEFMSIIDRLTTSEDFKGPKGDTVIGPQGPKGDTVIGPQGSRGEVGAMPSKKELLEIIEPLIPEVKDGETPSDARLLKLFKPFIPTKEKLLALIRPLIKAFEETFDKKLANFIADAKRMVREKGGGSSGGGMGNIITQSTAISSATTTVSLSYNVASNGKAIWFNYQGQQQAYGTHFTVSGKTITLLFTPQDSTYADIIYIRT